LKSAIRPLAEHLYREAKADRWRLPQAAFDYALEESCKKAFAGREPESREIARYLSSLHLVDLALACACAEGHAAAWDHFVLEMRPILYRAADALDPSGGARELADSLYADLYGLDEHGTPRQSLLRYFHGRSSLGTWLRAVLAQRHIDRVRAQKRIEPLSGDMAERHTSPGPPDAECRRLVDILRHVLQAALARLAVRDRLRMSCYYAEQLTLAQTGRVLREHEATVSRRLSRTRREVRDHVESELRAQGLNDAQVRRCFECATEDPGPMDLAEMFERLPRESRGAPKAGEAAKARKESAQDRSI
jgi:RNA polymerase sigma-70 factor (ECF subfamily)